jgi:hypothetical protein
MVEGREDSAACVSQYRTTYIKDKCTLRLAMMLHVTLAAARSVRLGSTSAFPQSTPVAGSLAVALIPFFVEVDFQKERLQRGPRHQPSCPSLLPQLQLTRNHRRRLRLRLRPHLASLVRTSRRRYSSPTQPNTHGQVV